MDLKILPTVLSSKREGSGYLLADVPGKKLVSGQSHILAKRLTDTLKKY